MLCALTQPSHRPCSLVALRPPLRVCEPFFKISFLALGSRSTSGSCRGQTTVRRDATVSSSITSRARIDSAAWAINPDHPSLNSTCGCPAPTAVLPLFSVVVSPPAYPGEAGYGGASLTRRTAAHDTPPSFSAINACPHHKIRGSSNVSWQVVRCRSSCRGRSCGRSWPPASSPASPCVTAQSARGRAPSAARPRAGAFAGERLQQHAASGCLDHLLCCALLLCRRPARELIMRPRARARGRAPACEAWHLEPSRARGRGRT